MVCHRSKRLEVLQVCLRSKKFEALLVYCRSKRAEQLLVEEVVVVRCSTKRALKVWGFGRPARSPFRLAEQLELKPFFPF